MSVLKRQLFWNTVQGAMQLSTIIVLGKIFDDRSAHTVATLLRSAEDVGISRRRNWVGGNEGSAQIMPSGSTTISRGRMRRARRTCDG